ncbi:SOS response-associated peptidase family protein [Gallaecimonas sp. GXIMD4217]|uniref:SOS response-associated peptidase n=1 Tax=Gallaecimonas sp. GXIMD4217 TaxID=3131927 RepID=UPI00311B3025
MCERVAVHGVYDGKRIIGTGFDSLELGNNGDLKPTQQLQCYVQEGDSASTLSLKWGLAARNSKRLLINAKAETVADLITFKFAFNTRRCLVPINGWYEWRQKGHRRQRYYFSSPEQHMLVAGIWWQPNERFPDGSVILLTQEAMRPCLERMPVLLRPEVAQAYLSNTICALELTASYQGPEILGEAVDGPIHF